MATNTSLGDGALANITIDAENTAIGYNALNKLITNAGNTAVGSYALGQNEIEANNTAIGRLALANTIGEENIGIGEQAGLANTTGSFNIYINNEAEEGGGTENNTIRIGHDKEACFISGIYEKTFDTDDVKYPVGVAANGQLGRMVLDTVPSGTILRSTNSSIPYGYIAFGTEALHYLDTSGHPQLLTVNLYKKS